MLCAQPRGCCWRTQEDVEYDLGLEKQAISKWFKNAGGVGVSLEGKKCFVDGKKQLATAGVYRHPGVCCPARVWWLAFTGNVGKVPIFDDRGERNSFRLEDEVPGEESGTETPAAVVAEDYDASGAAATAEDGEPSAADPDGKDAPAAYLCCSQFIYFVVYPRQYRRLTLL